jgi:hydroxyacylglutathione hydrolase
MRIKVFEFSPIQENTYVLYDDSNSCIIIDPGCYFDYEKEALVQFIDESSLKPMMLLNTHCHLDHVFGNKYIAEKYNLIPQIHKNEKSLLDMAPASGLMYNLPFDNYQGELIYLEDGQKISFGSDNLEVILAPGHSPGSLCFYAEKYGFLIGGDVLFQNSIGRTDLPGGDHETLIRSIKERILVLPDQTIVYSGHGPSTTVGRERMNNPFLQ